MKCALIVHENYLPTDSLHNAQKLSLSRVIHGMVFSPDRNKTLILSDCELLYFSHPKIWEFVELLCYSQQDIIFVFQSFTKKDLQQWRLLFDGYYRELTVIKKFRKRWQMPIRYQLLKIYYQQLFGVSQKVLIVAQTREERSWLQKEKIRYELTNLEIHHKIPKKENALLWLYSNEKYYQL